MAEGISAGCPYDDRSALTRVLSLNRWTAELDWTAVWTAVWFGVVRPPLPAQTASVSSLASARLAALVVRTSCRALLRPNDS